MYTKTIGVVELLDTDEVVFGYEDMVSYQDVGVLSWLDNNDKDDFNVDFFNAQPLQYLIQETLGGKFLVHNGYMQKKIWCGTYFHFCYHHNYEKQMICHEHMNDGREKGQSETMINFYQRHQQFLQN